MARRAGPALLSRPDRSRLRTNRPRPGGKRGPAPRAAHQSRPARARPDRRSTHPLAGRERPTRSQAFGRRSFAERTTDRAGARRAHPQRTSPCPGAHATARFRAHTGLRTLPCARPQLTTPHTQTITRPPIGIRLDQQPHRRGHGPSCHGLGLRCSARQAPGPRRSAPLARQRHHRPADLRTRQTDHRVRSRASASGRPHAGFPGPDRPELVTCRPPSRALR